MKISAFSPVLNTSKINNNQNISFIKNTALNADVVSFSGKYYNPATQNKNVKEAVMVGTEIYSKLESGASKSDIAAYIIKNNPDITVLPIEKLSEISVDPKNYGAFFQYKFDDNYNIENPSLYINLNQNQLKTPITDLQFAIDTAHEYTHLRQLKNGYNQKFYNRITPNDGAYAGVLTALGDFIFSTFDNDFQANFLSPSFDYKDSIGINLTGKIVPREKNITKAQILNKNKLSEGDFKKLVNQLFKYSYYNLLKNLMEHPEYAEPKLYKRLSKIVEKEENIEKLESDLKAYCKFKAMSENEAYTTESQVAKKVLKTDQMLNIDVFPMFYNMLSEAL